MSEQFHIRKYLKRKSALARFPNGPSRTGKRDDDNRMEERRVLAHRVARGLIGAPPQE